MMTTTATLTTKDRKMSMTRPRRLGPASVVVACSAAAVLLLLLAGGGVTNAEKKAEPDLKSLFSGQKQPAGEQCFCKLEGQIDDCLCSVDTVDHFNNMKIYPRLQSILLKPFFRFFQYNPNKPCPFWDTANDKCASPNCGVKPCQPDEIPPGLKGARGSEEAAACEEEELDEALDSSVDATLSDVMRQNLQEWREYDDAEARFCEVDEDQCPDCDYVDLTLNPERFTGYAGKAAHQIWKTIYEENCFRPPTDAAAGLLSSEKPNFSRAFLQDTLDDMCLEKRAFYRAVSGLHSSITIHLCANYLMKKSDSPFSSSSDRWGPNLEEFQARFDPLATNGQGPYWLRNLYFVYLLELRAITKAAPYLEHMAFYTGNPEEDKDTQIAVKELFNLMRSFPDQFDESVMFAAGGENESSAKALKKEFQEHFRNISRVMDCVGCDKCRLWGKLQVTGLGTALKILFAEGNRSLLVTPEPEPALEQDLEAAADRMQRLTPPAEQVAVPDYGLTRNEIVSLFNAFGRISTSIQQLERFREMVRKQQGGGREEL